MPANASWAVRLPTDPGPQSRYASPSAGITIQAWIILVWKASPTQTAARTSPPIPSPSGREPFAPAVMAPDTASAASTSSRISSESEMFPRSRATVAGLTARISAAIRPAAVPASLDTAW